MSALLEATARASHVSEGVRSLGVLETFFEKFELFAEAPDAVAKMRELVRHLAVTGMLVAQYPSDESGDLVLKKISAERLMAVKAGRISLMKALPEVGEDELSFDLRPG